MAALWPFEVLSIYHDIARQTCICVNRHFSQFPSAQITGIKHNISTLQDVDARQVILRFNQIWQPCRHLKLKYISRLCTLDMHLCEQAIFLVSFSLDYCYYRWHQYFIGCQCILSKFMIKSNMAAVQPFEDLSIFHDFAPQTCIYVNRHFSQFPSAQIIVIKHTIGTLMDADARQVILRFNQIWPPCSRLKFKYIS